MVISKTVCIFVKLFAIPLKNSHYSYYPFACTYTKKFCIGILALLFTLLSSFNTSLSTFAVIKDLSKNEKKEECKSESGEDSEIQELLGTKKSRIIKKILPPDLLPQLTAHLCHHFKICHCFLSENHLHLTYLYFSFFQRVPFYIAFHSFIFYEN